MSGACDEAVAWAVAMRIGAAVCCRGRFSQCAVVALATLPLKTGAQEAQGKIAMCPIPSTGELLPIVGFGSSSIFSGDDFAGAAALLDALRDMGGKFMAAP